MFIHHKLDSAVAVVADATRDPRRDSLEPPPARAAKFPYRPVIYVFHANTNLGDTRNGGAVKAKVHVPRLDGASVGALATRTPHRPLPVGEETHADTRHGDGSTILSVKVSAHISRGAVTSSRIYLVSTDMFYASKICRSTV